MHQSFRIVLKAAASAFCTFLIIFSAIPSGGYASAVTAKTTDYLNLRESAATNSKVIATIGKNVALTVLDDSNPNWARVKTSGGKTGYCCKQYLNFSGSGSTAASSSASKAYASALESLNMRISPSLSGKVVTVLSKGSVVTILDNSNSQWAKVQSRDGKQGWCSKSYLKISEPVASPAAPSGSVKSTSGSAVATAVTTDELKLRSGAGTSYKVLEVLGKGIQTSVLDNSNSAWVKVKSPSGNEGWCSRQYLKVTGSTAPAPSQGSAAGQSGNSGQQTSGSDTVTGAQVTADVLRLRQSANTSSTVMDNLARGTVLKVLDASVSGWVKVQTSDGKTGYVCSEYVKLLYNGESGDSGTAATNGTVTISASSQSLPQGKTLYLQASDSSGGSVTWASSNTAVATVSNGFVLAVAPGTAQITAQAGSDSVACGVTVTAAEPVRSAYASPNVAAPGDTVTFTAVTDDTRDGVQFSVAMPDGSTKVIQTSGSTTETTNGVTTKVWTGTTSFPNAGTYSFTARSSIKGTMSTVGFSSSALVSADSDYTVSTGEYRRASDKMLALLAKWEGPSSTVYSDSIAASHVATIGYGCTIGKNAVFYNNLSQTEMWSLMVNSANNGPYTTELNKMIQNNHFLMSQNQADCLIDFAYNIGAGYFNNSQETDFRKIMDNAVVPPNIPSGSTISATVTHDADVRQNSGTASSTVCQVTSGTAVTITGSDFGDKRDGWYQVLLSNGVSGWINSGYVSLSNSAGLVHDLNYTNAYAFGTELIRWNQGGGKFYEGLFYRRLGEANVYSYNDYDVIKYNKYGYGYPDCAKSLS